MKISVKVALLLIAAVAVLVAGLYVDNHKNDGSVRVIEAAVKSRLRAYPNVKYDHPVYFVIQIKRLDISVDANDVAVTDVEGVELYNSEVGITKRPKGFTYFGALDYLSPFDIVKNEYGFFYVNDNFGWVLLGEVEWWL